MAFNMDYVVFDARHRAWAIPPSGYYDKGEVRMIGPNQNGDFLNSFSALASDWKKTKASGAYFVASIPSYFGNAERRDLLDCAKKSKASGASLISSIPYVYLEPVRLMHECTAIALSYGYDLNLTADEQLTVAFVFLGENDTQISIASFQMGVMKILSHASDPFLGVKSFDQVLVDHFSSQCKGKYVNFASLQSKCEKLRRDLMEKTKAHFNFYGSIKEDMNREKFDQLSSALLVKFVVLFSQAVEDAKVDIHTISSVEVMGYTLPSISEVLRLAFNIKPNLSLNAVECIRKGCALQCAMHSNPSICRKYDFKDSFPFSFGVSSINKEVVARNKPFPDTISFDKEVFARNKPFPDTISFDFRSDSSQSKLSCSDFHDVIQIWSLPRNSTKNLEEIYNIQFELDINGIIKLPKKFALKNTSNLDKDGDTQMDVGHCSTSNDNSAKHTAKAKTKVTISEEIDAAMSEADVDTAFINEFAFLKNDEHEEQVKNLKNILESTVYDIRKKINKTYSSFVNEGEKNIILEKLKDTEQWLYDGGEDENENTYHLKIEELNKMIEPIITRYTEEEGKRKQLQESLMNLLRNHIFFAEKMLDDFCRFETEFKKMESMSSDYIKNHMELLPEMWKSRFEEAQLMPHSFLNN